MVILSFPDRSVNTPAVEWKQEKRILKELPVIDIIQAVLPETVGG